ncbi:MAG: hypothetical protein HUU35_11550, partial [Armatimonadetes bacterium]|nr:hypothetical protein [Armatimonadota bacterium]
MSHVIVVLSGLADDPVEELDGQTPLAAAATPALDQLAAFAEVGLLRLLPEQDDDHPAIGVDLTSLAMLGYEPVTSGRGAVELLGAGAELGRRDVGLRLDLISTGAGVDPFPEALTAQEAETLWPDLERLSHPGITIRQASAMKALALWEEGPVEVGANPPGELDPARPLDEQMPEGEQEQAIRRLIDDAREMLAEHPLNRRRRDEQRPTLDALWPWGFGRAPE